MTFLQSASELRMNFKDSQVSLDGTGEVDPLFMGNFRKNIFMINICLNI